MKKKTAIAAASLLLIGFLATPLVVRPKGFSGHEDTFINHYLRGVSHLADMVGADSTSTRIRQRFEGTPPDRVLLQFEITSRAEAKYMAEAAFDGYPSRSSFLSCRTDLENGMLRVEIDRGSQPWFEAHLKKASKKFRGHP